MLTPISEAHYGEESLLALNLASAERYGAFIDAVQEDSGVDTGYRRCGTVVVARDLDDNAALEDLFDFHRRLGLEVIRLTGRECREAESRLSPRVRGGILVEGDHQVDNRALLTALRIAAEKRGATFISGRVTSILRSGDVVSGAVLDDGSELAAGALVVAAGVWSQELAPEGALPPVRPVKGQLLHLRGPSFLQRNVRGLDVYIVPRADGRVVVGATMEERGSDLRPTAEAVYELLRDAYELVPGILELELVEHAVGLRPATPDNAPAIGATSMEGLFAATGHFRNGVLLAPITAEAISALVNDEPLDLDLEPFSPARFRTPTGAAS